jgi:hypothetical protein
MKHIKVSIFTDGLVMKFTDENDRKRSYKREIPFPRDMQEEICNFINTEQKKIDGGIIEVEVFRTISMELGTLAT